MNRTLALFSFQGRVRRLPYAIWSAAIFAAQYGFVIAVFETQEQTLEKNWRFYVMPLRSLAEIPALPTLALPLAVALTLVVSWALAALAFRRATDASVSGWVAAFTVAPIIQIGAIVVLCLVPTRSSVAVSMDCQTARINWIAAAQGILAGVALTVFAVAVGALVFGTYGFGIFVVAPVVIGAVTAYLANRQNDIGLRRTTAVIIAALLLGGVGLGVGALEGIVCIVIASPLALGAALIGGAIGRTVALSRKHSAAQSLLSVALLPLVFASEQALPPNYSFSTQEVIEVAAKPHDVWLAIVHMDTIKSSLALPFKLGVAYPMRGDIVGNGVGATRIGTFSTGIAVERVTEWIQDRKLGFEVMTDPPAMHELSPYKHVNAPHVRGYFRTTYTSFEIVPLGKGHVRIIERTDHELKLDPVLYWMPFARWIIHENNMRVLTHIRESAEHSGA